MLHGVVEETSVQELVYVAWLKLRSRFEHVVSILKPSGKDWNFLLGKFQNGLAEVQSYWNGYIPLTCLTAADSAVELFQELFIFVRQMSEKQGLQGRIPELGFDQLEEFLIKLTESLSAKMRPTTLLT